MALRKCYLTSFCTLNDIFVPAKTIIGSNNSFCYESPPWCFAEKNLSLSLQLNPKISGDFRPSEQIFPETNRWVRLFACCIQFFWYFAYVNSSSFSPSEHVCHISDKMSLEWSAYSSSKVASPPRASFLHQWDLPFSCALISLVLKIFTFNSGEFN